MWTIIFVILAIVLGLFLFIKVRIIADDKAYKKKYKNIFDAHKSIGYPSLTDEQQFDVLDTENTKHISQLTQYEFVPSGLLNHYINIDPEKYFRHLKSANLLDKMRFNSNQIFDGFYINSTDKGFEYIFVDRNRIEFRKYFPSYDKLLKYLVYVRLKMHAPDKYKYLDKKYYA